MRLSPCMCSHFRRRISCWRGSHPSVWWAWANVKWRPWQTTSAVLYSTEDYVAASFRSRESEKTIKWPMGRRWKKHLQEDKKNVQVAPHVPADGEEPTNVSLFDASALWSTSNTLFCTTEFVPLNWGNLAFRKRISKGGWRAFVTDPTCICRHGSPLRRTRGSTDLLSLPLTTSICNFADCLFLFFHHCIIFSVPIRSASQRWNYFWGAPILETIWSDVCVCMSVYIHWYSKYRWL